MFPNSAKMPRSEISHEDMDRLIDLVRRNPVLYDSSHKDYKYSNHVESAWNRIAKQMGQPGMSGSEWRKKWVNRRDTYVKKKRQIRNRRSSIVVERAKRWRYFDALSFLDRFLEGFTDSSIPEDNVTNEDDSSEAMSGEEDADESSNNLCPQKSDSGKRPAHSPSPCATSAKRKPPDPDSGNGAFSVMPVPGSMTFNGTDEVQGSFVSSMADQMDPPLADHYHPSQSPLTTRVTCPDYHLLFQSYAHRLERLPERMQSFIQFQIAQLFFNAENPDLPSMHIIPLPSSSTLGSSSSSFSASSFRHAQRRRQDDVNDQQQQPMPSEDPEASTEGQGEIHLEFDSSDILRNTFVKAEKP